MSRGPAITATIVALALINVGAAASIVALTRPGAFMPLGLGLALTAVGVVVLALAVRLWQKYLQDIRDPMAEGRRG